MAGDSAAFSVIVTGKTVRDEERVEVGVRVEQRWFRCASEQGAKLNGVAVIKRIIWKTSDK